MTDALSTSTRHRNNAAIPSRNRGLNLRLDKAKPSGSRYLTPRALQTSTEIQETSQSSTERQKFSSEDIEHAYSRNPEIDIRTPHQPLDPTTPRDDAVSAAENQAGVVIDPGNDLSTPELIQAAITNFLTRQGTYFSTKYVNDEVFRDKTHRLMLAREYFLSTIDPDDPDANRKRLRVLAFEFAKLLEMRDDDGWTEATQKRARTAAGHYTKPAIDTNNYVTAISAGSSLAVAGLALAGMSPVVVGSASLVLGTVTPFLIAQGSLGQSYFHAEGLAKLNQRGPIFSLSVMPKDVINLQRRGVPLRISDDIKRDIIRIRKLLKNFDDGVEGGSAKTLRVVSAKLQKIGTDIKALQADLVSRGLNTKDQERCKAAIKNKDEDAIKTFMLLACRKLQQPDKFLELQRLKNDREFFRRLRPFNRELEPSSQAPDPQGEMLPRKSPAAHRLPEHRGIQRHANLRSLANPDVITDSMLREKLNSFVLDLLLADTYQALNIQEGQSIGRAVRALLNFIASTLGLTSYAAAFYDNMFPEHLEHVLGVHPSTLSVAGVLVSFLQAAVFAETQGRLGTDDQLTRLAAMFEIQILSGPGDFRTKPFDPTTDKLRAPLDADNPINPKRIDAAAMGWGERRCQNIWRILRFDIDGYLLALITHILPKTPPKEVPWTPRFTATPGAPKTSRVPKTAEDLLITLRNCPHAHRKTMLEDIAPYLADSEVVDRLLRVIGELDSMAVEAKATNVARVLTNQPICLTSEEWIPPEYVLQAEARDAFEQSLLYARTEFLREKVPGAIFAVAPQWTQEQLESGDLLLATLRGWVDSRTAGTALPEFVQKFAQHNSKYVLGSFSTQFLKALGLFSSGPAILFNQQQIARIITMAFAGGAMVSALGNLGLVFAYHKNVALKFSHQNRNQALGTVEVPNTGPWPFLKQFQTLAARPITEADLGDGDLNLQQDLSFFKDFVEQAQAAPLGGFKGKDGNWKVPLAKWAGYFVKQAENLDKLTPEEVEKDLQSAIDAVLQLVEEQAREEREREAKRSNNRMPGNLRPVDSAPFMADDDDDAVNGPGDVDDPIDSEDGTSVADDDDAISASGDVDDPFDSEDGTSVGDDDDDDDANDIVRSSDDDASDESTSDEIESDSETEVQPFDD